MVHKHKMWTLHKAEECRLEDREEQGKDQENLKFKVALSAIQEDDKSITCLLTLWLAQMWGIIIRGLLYQNCYNQMIWVTIIFDILIY